MSSEEITSILKWSTVNCLTVISLCLNNDHLKLVIVFMNNQKSVRTNHNYRVAFFLKIKQCNTKIFKPSPKKEISQNSFP